MLVGERVEVETPHPRAQAAIDAAQLDGRRLESVEAFGKNLVLRFEGGIVLRSHLRMSGRWSVRPRGAPRIGRPWLVLAGSRAEALLWNGPVLELHARAIARLGPDILASPPDFEAMLARLRRSDGSRFVGEALLDQSRVAGIGNPAENASAVRRIRRGYQTPGTSRNRVSSMYRTYRSSPASRRSSARILATWHPHTAASTQTFQARGLCSR